MTTSNTLTNGCHGWHFEYVEQLTDTMRLKIVTMRTYSGEIVTRGSVFLNSCYKPERDWSAFLMRTSARGTKQNVTAQHTQCLTKLAEIKASVVKHYKELGTLSMEEVCHI